MRADAEGNRRARSNEHVTTKDQSFNDVFLSGEQKAKPPTPSRHGWGANSTREQSAGGNGQRSWMKEPPSGEGRAVWAVASPCDCTERAPPRTAPAGAPSSLTRAVSAPRVAALVCPSAPIHRFLRSQSCSAQIQGVPPAVARASFRSWAADININREIAEACLVHTVKGVEGASQRSDLFKRRRSVMQQWADYVTGAPRADVIPLHG